MIITGSLSPIDLCFNRTVQIGSLNSQPIKSWHPASRRSSSAAPNSGAAFGTRSSFWVCGQARCTEAAAAVPTMHYSFTALLLSLHQRRVFAAGRAALKFLIRSCC